MEPLLLDIPAELTTERLLLRIPRAGDGERVNAAIRDSIPELSLWMPWAHPLPTPQDTELWVRRAAVKFLVREQFHFNLYLKDSDTCLGVCGPYRVDWKVPSAEIGYWLRTPYTGKGYMHEALATITRFTLDVINAQRVELRCDERNIRSTRVAERAGYTLEGVMRNGWRDPRDALCNMRVYSIIPSAPP